MITEKNYIVDLSKLSDRSLMFEFAEETFFDERAIGKKSSRDKFL